MLQYRGVSEDDYMDILEEIQDSAKDFLSFDDWMEYIDEYTKQLREQSRQGSVAGDTVTLSTMHCSKGLEYSYVFIMDAVEDITPHRNRSEMEIWRRDAGCSMWQSRGLSMDCMCMFPRKNVWKKSGDLEICPGNACGQVSDKNRKHHNPQAVWTWSHHICR